jgi:hypothetical protein
MQKKRMFLSDIWQILIITLLCLLRVSASAQINFATIDSTKWEIDTAEKTIIIVPKFQFQSDTTISFYELVDNKKSTFLTINYVKESMYLFGTFTGTSQFKNTNRYIHLNLPDSAMDSSAILNMTDTIIQSENT